MLFCCITLSQIQNEQASRKEGLLLADQAMAPFVQFILHNP